MTSAVVLSEGPRPVVVPQWTAWFSGVIAIVALVLAIGVYRSMRRLKRTLVELQATANQLADENVRADMQELADKLSVLTQGENKRTLDHLDGLFARVAILDKEGSWLAVALASVGAVVAVVAIGVTDWITKGAAPAGWAIPRSVGCAAVAALAVWAFIKYRRHRHRRDPDTVFSGGIDQAVLTQVESMRAILDEIHNSVDAIRDESPSAPTGTN